MFKNLSIKNKLYLGFGSIVAIILILLGMAYNNFSRLSEANATGTAIRWKCWSRSTRSTTPSCKSRWKRAASC